jgi:hypothetical protein
MAERPARNPKPKTGAPARTGGEDRFPSNAELLHELRFHGAKPAPPRKIPIVGRRTRDYLLLAGIGSGLIIALSFRLLSDSEASVVWRLALTGVASWCGLLWFIFYGVMSRY